MTANQMISPIHQLFAGGPDTPCRTTWHAEDGIAGEIVRVECVEVPLDDLREALDATQRYIDELKARTAAGGDPHHL